jgi:hypothetical protein
LALLVAAIPLVAVLGLVLVVVSWPVVLFARGVAVVQQVVGVQGRRSYPLPQFDPAHVADCAACRRVMDYIRLLPSDLAQPGYFRPTFFQRMRIRELKYNCPDEQRKRAQERIQKYAQKRAQETASLARRERAAAAAAYRNRVRNLENAKRQWWELDASAGAGQDRAAAEERRIQREQEVRRQRWQLDPPADPA